MQCLRSDRIINAEYLDSTSVGSIFVPIFNERTLYMSIFKKIISLTLVFLLVFSCLPTAAFAETVEAAPEITEEAVVEEEAIVQEDLPAEEPVEESPEEPPEEEPVQEEASEVIPDDKSEPVSAPEEEAEEPEEDPVPEEVTEDETDPEAEPSETEVSEETEEFESSKDEETPAEEEAEVVPESEDSTENIETEEEAEAEEPEVEPEEEPAPQPCIFTVELQDVRDNITIRRNGDIVAAVYGNPAPGDGHYYIVGPVRLEELASDLDGCTRLAFDALTGDMFTIETVQPVYAKINYYSSYKCDVVEQNGMAVLSITLEGDTSIQVNGDYTASAGFFPIRVRRMLRAASGAWTPPDAIYVSLGSCYDTYSSTAIVNGHTGVYFFEVEDLGEGHFVSATCGSTTKHMVTGTHYKVARIAEYAARSYLDYGSGCCSQRAQRALAWITYHGQSEYDWRRYNENRFRILDR